MNDARQPGHNTALVSIFGLPQYYTLQSPPACLSIIDKNLADLKANQARFEGIVAQSIIIEEDHKKLLVEQYKEYLNQLAEARGLYCV